MLPSRRFVVFGACGGLALVGAGAGAVWRVSRMPRVGLQPWKIEPATGLDPRLAVLRHAILAPSPHNRQPWVLRLVGEDQVDLTCDLERRLPMTDPFDRQTTIGFGCFLALAKLAAPLEGQSLTISPFPEGMPDERLNARPVARLAFTPASSARRDPLSEVILARRSTKEPYDMDRPVPAAVVESLREAAGGLVRFGATIETGTVTAFRALCWAAWQTEVRNPRTYRESVDLMRIGADEIDANPDGIDLGGPMMEGLKLAGLLTRTALIDPSSQAFKGGEAAYRALFEATPAFAWIGTTGNDRISQLAVGEAYLRINLAATKAGLAMHPVSQALQEFPEMAELRAKAHALAGGNGGTLQMLARLGYGPGVAPAPRWPLARRLIN